MRTETTGQYEMLWDCPGCGTGRLLGLTHRHCPNCGAPQDPSRRYFPPAGEEVAVADHPYHGADLTCPACETPNAAKATFCVGCGSPMEGARTVGTRGAQTAVDGVFQADSASKASAEAESTRQRARADAHAEQAQRSGAAPSAGGRGNLLKGFAGVGCVGLAVLAVVAVAVFFLWKKDASLVVSGHRWERTVEVETFSPAHDDAWREQVPAGAYGVACTKAQRGTEKVADGETCTDTRKDQGDGTFVVVQDCAPKYREEPVYGDRCSYTVDRWQVTRTERAEGAALAPEPSWPAVTLGHPGTCLGCQREGARKESYTVQLTDDATQDTHTCTLAEPRWKSMAVGSRWATQVGVVSGALDCDALVAKERP